MPAEPKGGSGPSRPDDEAQFETQLEQLLESWFLRLENGETPAPDPTAHCAEHPHILAAFLRVLGHSEAVEHMLGSGKPESDPDRSMPERLGEFEVLLPIGSGGAGNVYLARQTSLQRLVALKVLRPSGDLRSRQRLRREAEVAASLEHPGIVPIYGVGEDGDRAWIAMKWLTGPALDQVDAPLDSKRAATIVAAAARALHEAHTVGIVHRDIKPSNLVLDQESPCIVDFGLARDGDQTVRTTLEGHVAGTLLYMSPEQLSSGGGSTTTLDARTDIYSLGATLYELLAGRPPFEEDLPAKVIHRILYSEPPALERIAGIDRDLATITGRALDKDRERRFSSALAMAEDLERYLAGESILSRPVGLTTQLVRFTRKNRRATITVACAGLVAIVLAIVLAWNVQQQSLTRAATLADVATRIDSGELLVARGLLAPLLAEDGGDAEDLNELHARLVACERLEDLLDQVQALPEDTIGPELETALAGLVDDDLPADRRLAARFVRPLGLALAGKVDDAIPLARALPEGRARTALMLAFGGHETWDLPASDDSADPPLEHLFTVLAMRFANRPLPERRAEIDRGRAIAFGDPRLRLQHAIQYINDDEHRLAYEALSGVRRDGSYPLIVRRLLMREAVWVDDPVAARSHLDALLRDFPRASWSAFESASVLETQYWLDVVDPDLLAWARDRWPENWLIAVVAARELVTSDWQAAAALLADTDQFARNPDQREESVLLRLYALAAPLRSFWAPTQTEPSTDEAERLEELEQAAADFAETATDPERMVAARIVQSRSRLARGDWEGAFATLEAITVDPAPEKTLELGIHAHNWFAHETRRVQASPWGLAMLERAEATYGGRYNQRMRALQTVFAELLSSMPSRQRILGRPSRALAYLLHAEFSLFARDPDAARESVERARPLISPELDSGESGMLQIIERLLSR